jgi:hypothetical protein
MFSKCSLGILVLMSTATLAPVPVEKPKLKFKQNGKDLIASLTVKVNNSPHVLWTHALVQGKEVLLRYYVIQNRDLFARSQKTIEVQWRLTNRKKDDHTFRVEVKFEPDTAELATLLSQLARLKKEEDRPPPPPCHPGCFPAGTLVLTPGGPRSIETIRVGDVVLNVPQTGKPTAIKVAAVHVGRSPLVEVETGGGKFLTTAKQPLLLSDGQLRSAGTLTDKDEIVRCHDGRRHNTQVRGVKEKDTQTVYNLVLEVRGTFVANGYLVQSKPPAVK